MATTERVEAAMRLDLGPVLALDHDVGFGEAFGPVSALDGVRSAYVAIERQPGSAHAFVA
jgi:hypothetical protein